MGNEFIPAADMDRILKRASIGIYLKTKGAVWCDENLYRIGFWSLIAEYFTAE
jgi:hypothetical protein